VASEKAKDWSRAPHPIQVDPAFRRALPRLREEEASALEGSLLQEGCRDALVVWRSPEGPILLDGHNRLEICERHGIAYDVLELDLPTREAALDWIDRCQLARRNLTPAQMHLLRGRRYNRLKCTHGGNRRTRPQHDGLKTAEILAAEYHCSRASIERAGRFADSIDQLSEIDPGLEARILAGLESPSQRTVVEAADLAAHDPEAGWRRLKGTMTSSSCEWNSPREIIDAAEALLGTIDLDPCAPQNGPFLVPARTHYTPKEDGLSRAWAGKVYLNPPYGREIGLWTRKLLEEHGSGRVTEALALLPVRTDTQWASELRELPRCFLTGRLMFSDSKNTAPFASMTVYLGPHLERFCSVFSALGDTYVLYDTTA